ncbi:MAG: acetyl-CoA hydrolase/transferase [Deltaproteobacteria bacterium]|jgi:acyl-CoA hydrolase/RimJ/RimL family protein N-acetyltransferase|nr:acetyl-CoA hydrolase/transferase [Deltaproteobacteria bacterium]
MNDDLINNANIGSLDAIADKMKTADEAVLSVKSGDNVFIGTACATPRALIQALEAIGDKLFDVKLIHFLTDGAIPLENGFPKTRFKHKVFFVGTDTQEAIKQGTAQYIPISIAHLPRLIENETIPISVAMIQVSPPDANGYVSLGVSVDITRAAVLKAKTVIAEVNPNMPYTHGNSLIPMNRIDTFVEVQTPVIEYLHKPADAIGERIARYVARIIHDNSTLHTGIGRIPNEMLKYLTNRKNLSIHSDVITEPVIDLIAKGVLTGPIATSYCMGTKALYGLIDRNTQFSFHPIDYICRPDVFSQVNRLVSVTQAFSIDLMGQVCSDQFGGELYGGLSAEPEFIRAAALSPGGKSIICLSSTTDGGKESRIRPLLREGEGVTIPRSEVHYVITEYGSAYLYCKSIQEKALELIEIAHPEFRSWLLAEAIRLGYCKEGQTLKNKTAYPENEEREIQLKTGEKVLLRPAKASDAGGLQDIFYNLKPQDVYTRFFTHLASLTDKMAQHLCNVDYEHEMAFAAVMGEGENEKVIGSSCYFVDATDNLAEVAYMIRPEWQKCGLGTALQQRMTEYAKSKGLRGFKANILLENSKMQRVIQKGDKVTFSRCGNELEVVSLF